LAISNKRGSSASFATRPSGTLKVEHLRDAMADLIEIPYSQRHAIRRMEPNTLIATGNSDRDPFINTGCSNSSAGPPPGRFMTRSAISATRGWWRRESERESAPLHDPARRQTAPEYRGSRLDPNVDRDNAEGEGCPRDAHETDARIRAASASLDGKVFIDSGKYRYAVLWPLTSRPMSGSTWRE